MQKQILCDIRNNLMSNSNSSEQTVNFKVARENDDLFRSSSAENMLQKLQRSDNHLKILKEEEME